MKPLIVLMKKKRYFTSNKTMRHWIRFQRVLFFLNSLNWIARLRAALSSPSFMPTSLPPTNLSKDIGYTKPVCCSITKEMFWCCLSPKKCPFSHAPHTLVYVCARVCVCVSRNSLITAPHFLYGVVVCTFRPKFINIPFPLSNGNPNIVAVKEAFNL